MTCIKYDHIKGHTIEFFKTPKRYDVIINQKDCYKELTSKNGFKTFEEAQKWANNYIDKDISCNI